MNWFYYQGKDANEKIFFIRVSAARKPSLTASRTTWPINEFCNESHRWVMPGFPEITFRRLNQMLYIGKVTELK